MNCIPERSAAAGTKRNLIGLALRGNLALSAVIGIA
jgi:hypothetical protein